MLMGDAVYVVDALGTPAAVHEQMADDGIAHERVFAGAGRRRKRDRRTIEIRSGKTATLTLVAEMTGGTSTMGDRKVCHSVGHHPPAKLAFDDFLRHHTATRESHRRQELTVRHLRQTFARTAHADETLDSIIVRFEVHVADRPVFSVAIATSGLEFVVTEAIALARPTECFPPHLSSTDPHERFVGWEGIRMLQVVDEELMAVLVTGITQALDGLCAQKLLLIAETAELQLIGPYVLGEVARRDTGRSRF
jgi:hypothetical protein